MIRQRPINIVFSKDKWNSRTVDGTKNEMIKLNKEIGGRVYSVTPQAPLNISRSW